MLGGIAGAVGSGRRHGGFAMNMPLVSANWVVMEGCDDFIRVDLGRISSDFGDLLLRASFTDGVGGGWVGVFQEAYMSGKRHDQKSMGSWGVYGCKK